VVIDAHRPLDFDNVADGNGAVLVLRDSRERVPSADGSGAEAFPEAADASGSDRDDDDGGSGAEEDGNEGGEGASRGAASRRGGAAFARRRRRPRPLTRRAPAADANGRRVRRRLEAAERRVQVRRRARGDRGGRFFIIFGHFCCLRRECNADRVLTAPAPRCAARGVAARARRVLRARLVLRAAQRVRGV